MDAGSRTADPVDAARIWLQFAEILQRDQPVTLRFSNDEIAAIPTEVGGVRMDARGELTTLPNWRLGSGVR